MENIASGRERAKGGYPAYFSRGEEIFNAVSHIAGGGLGFLFTVALLALAENAAEYAAFCLYGVGVVTLYTMSALYHFLPTGRAKAVFRIFDHCTIFLLIAGTYSVYCLVPLYGTTVGWAVLGAEWGIAAAGITMNAIAMNNKAVKGISMALYFVAGWMAVAFLVPLFHVVSAACFFLLLAGGIAYTAGIVFFAFGKRVKFFHSVWHLFVILGTVLQFVSILEMIL